MQGRLLLAERNNERLRADVERLTSETESYNRIEIPTEGLKEIEAKLKLCDKFTAGAIADYLVLDTYELVRNLAKTVNSQNAAEAIAYRDGAIARNDAVIKVLRSIGAGKSDQFKNRITGSVDDKIQKKEDA